MKTLDNTSDQYAFNASYEWRETYALALLAVIKTFSMWKSWNRICSTMVDGFHTPDAVRAAPKAEPATVCVTRSMPVIKHARCQANQEG